MNSFTALDLEAFERFIQVALATYQSSAPTVVSHLNDLYLRVIECPEQVTLFELTQVTKLLENSIWMQANHAANFIYRLRNRLNMDTTGHAGF